MSIRRFSPRPERPDGKTLGIEHPVHIQPLDVDAAGFLFQEAHILPHRIAGGAAADQRFQGHAAPLVRRHHDLVGENPLRNVQNIVRDGDDMIGGIVQPGAVSMGPNLS